MNSLAKANFEYIFIDWHGVVGNRGFWCNQSKLDFELSSWCNKVFNDKEILNQWMRGNLSLDDLVYTHGAKIEVKKIVELFDKDKEEYGPNINFLEAIKVMFPQSEKVLLSDNMDIFVNRVLKINSYLIDYFTTNIISCEYGVLKTDTPISLFNISLDKLKLKDFSNSLLIDDNFENCNKFAKLGGRYILIN